MSVINKVERLVKLERRLYSLSNDKDCIWLYLRCLCRNFPFQNFETRNIIWTFWILLQIGKWALERQANISNKFTFKFNVYNYMYCFPISFLCFVSQHFLYEIFFYIFFPKISILTSHVLASTQVSFLETLQNFIL